MAAQGDMLLRKIDALPDDVKELSAKNGVHVLAHSETGHNHVIKDRSDIKFYEHANDNFKAFIVIENKPALLEHMRSYRRHETIEVQPGIYEIRRQREEDVFGDIRRALD